MNPSRLMLTLIAVCSAAALIAAAPADEFAAAAPARATATPAPSPLPPPLDTEVAPGIHLFRTPPYGDVGLDGNSIAIIGDDGVLVFDANGTPAAARAVLARIRLLTRLPVRYLVYSHWHWDHWYGAEVYADSFPGLVIVAHEQTRRLMDGPAIRFNQPGLDAQLPEHIRAVEESLAAARASAPGSERAAKWAAHVERDRFFLEQKRAARHTLPTLTFTDSLTIHLGKREIRVLHVDRAITPGDAFLYLPAEHLVVAGDLLVNPLTFALFCYPAGWIRSLEWIDALDAAKTIPGHGAALADEQLLHSTLDVLKRERSLALDMHTHGTPVSDAVKNVLADDGVKRLRDALTGGDAGQNEAFGYYMGDWFVRRVYQESEGALPDSIPAHP
jgi:glyoxylase-like metal-dependent hydrolase (beta-lactamase superfamily II)